MKLILKLIWIGLLMEILTMAIIKPYVVDFHLVSILAVSLHVLYTMIIIIASKNQFNMIFFIAFLARVFLMFFDIYARHIYILPQSGVDDGVFLSGAITISENISLLSEPVRGGYYTQLNGLLFYIIGPQQLFSHYINVLLSLSIVFIIYEILMMLDLKHQSIKIIVLLAAFFPNSLILSATFLREMYVTFFVAYSLYYFIKWYKFGRTFDMLFTLLMLGLASMLHSGVVGMYFGYAFVFMFYKQDERVYCFNSKTVPVFVFIVAVAFIATTQFSQIFLSKIIDTDGSMDILEVVDLRYGSSAYLTEITIDHPIQLILYTPIRVFYFLIAPLPIDWRGQMDMISFLTDSMFYLGSIIYFIKNRHSLKDKKVLAIGLILILISVSVVFGLGVSNAGQAIRHRHKIMPVFLILLAAFMNEKHLSFENAQIKAKQKIKFLNIAHK